MATKIGENSNISEVSESIMRGLQEMLEHTQGKIELSSNRVSATPPQEFSVKDIVNVRNKLNMSQGFFAKVIGVSKKTSP